MRQAALPPEASGTMLAVFEPGTPGDEIFASLTRADARSMRATGLRLHLGGGGREPGLAGRLAREGAIGAYRDLPISPTIAGCFALADAKVAKLLGTLAALIEVMTANMLISNINSSFMRLTA